MTGVAVITTANKYPEATMRWLDYFYSEEGTVLCRLGIEGESYEVVDGKYQLLDNIKNKPRRADAGPGSGPVGHLPGGYLPQYITNEVDQSAAQLPETKAANDVVRDYVVPFETVPRVKFTERRASSWAPMRRCRQLRHGECGEVHHGRKEPERVGRLRGGTEQYAG